MHIAAAWPGVSHCGRAPLPRACVSLGRVAMTTLPGSSCTLQVPVPNLALPGTSPTLNLQPTGLPQYLTSLPCLSSQCTYMTPAKGSLQPPTILCTRPCIHQCLLGLARSRPYACLARLGFSCLFLGLFSSPLHHYCPQPHLCCIPFSTVSSGLPVF